MSLPPVVPWSMRLRDRPHLVVCGCPVVSGEGPVSWPCVRPKTRREGATTRCTSTALTPSVYPWDPRVDRVTLARQPCTSRPDPFSLPRQVLSVLLRIFEDLSVLVTQSFSTWVKRFTKGTRSGHEPWLPPCFPLIATNSRTTRDTWLVHYVTHSKLVPNVVEIRHLLIPKLLDLMCRWLWSDLSLKGRCCTLQSWC